MALNGTVKVYLATDHPWTASPTWTEVTDDVLSVRIVRNLAGSGTCQIDLHDPTGVYDPDKFGGTYYLKEAWTHVKVDSFGTGASTMFRGWTAPHNGWLRAPGLNTATLTLQCVDAATLVARFDLDMGAQVAQWAPARVRLVLNNVADSAGLASWPASLVESLDADGTVYVDAFDGGGNAWAHIQQVARAERGAVFVTRAGVVKLYGKHTATNNYTVTPSVIVTDDGNASHLPLLAGSLRLSSQTVVRRVVVSTTDGTLVTSDNVGANEAPETWSSASLPIDTNAAQGLADFVIQARSAFDPYPASVSVVVAATGASNVSTSLIDTAGQIDLLSQVRVEATPVGQSSQQTWDCSVVGLSHFVTPESWQADLQLVPDEWWTGGIGPTENLRLDDATLGQLDQERLGY